MWPESGEEKAPLRTGLTTGSCATACCVAAAQYLFAQRQDDKVSILLPKGKRVDLVIESYQAIAQGVCTSTIKDAGDDPDVTHGARIFVELSLCADPGVFFHAAEGVGTVTRTGLVLAVGEPAINPVPRQMMTEHLLGFAETYLYQGGFNVAVGIENGAVIAQKTMNPRLGIQGGLSILGTTGIVRPFSCAAYIASIHQGIDVARANGLSHMAATTGNASETAIKDHYGLDDMALLEMGDFVGAVLKHIRKVEVQGATQLTKLSVCGGFGKISKLAQGHMDLNSRVSSIDLAALAELAATLGASDALQKRMQAANTSVQAMGFAQQENLLLADAVCAQAVTFARRYIPDHMALEVWAIDRQGQFVGFAKDGTS
ncbi:cobalt-precorrin-5B (C(1))-methyltransferase [Marinomonas posidonica]|uniref:Cobalt-precorrin-5B C(1)-methyltransferase n=1 Tax=Marinomonas posidonica (strain CECT 7376 / NCIMB 14433 / IVIA-Po-181) TaxID=491952 RepID=F6CST8_MARPP|nr:cobalt-precorrin-5B (C(1))-methyltransferase [Marinomonas posidonica]AEF53928.1 cobalt-precorrin-6A synthase (deacetylating) [Marinomonas posidonica IVIA-Po-181]